MNSTHVKIMHTDHASRITHHANADVEYRPYSWFLAYVHASVIIHFIKYSYNYFAYTLENKVFVN